MDDVHQALLIFNHELNKFNEHLAASAEDLSRCHDLVSPVWQDQMRRQYEAQYGPLREMIGNYVQRGGPAYIDFLEEKVMLAKWYLYGR
jgi:hypothetical protein